MFTGIATQTGFDLFRLSKSKEVVDLAPNTIRAYHRDGLPFYRQGKAVFVSKAELASFIRARPETAHKNAVPTKQALALQ